MGVRAWSLAWCTLLSAACGGTAGAAPSAMTPTAAAPSAMASPPRPMTVAAVAPATDDPSPAAEPEPPSARFAHADLDDRNDTELGPPPPLDDCEQRLRERGVSFKPARIGLGAKQDGVPICGAEQVVRYRRGPGEIEYSTSPLLTCQMALALADLEVVAQELAEAELGARITRIDHLGTYNCRKMALYDLISEHSYANGIDLRRFTFANGKTADVLRDFKPTEAEATAASTRFLRRLANALFDEQVFSVVVTPYFDRAHRNHVHVDLARYRVDGSRP